jgi:hypothetical protein
MKTGRKMWNEWVDLELGRLGYWSCELGEGLDFIVITTPICGITDKDKMYQLLISKIDAI